MSSDSIYTSTVGKKFNPDGSVKLYPGNTIICFCDARNDVYTHLDAIQERLMSLEFASKFTLLPMSSMHMTVMQLLCDQARVPEQWSSKLALDTSLNETDKFFLKTVPQIDPPENFRMRYKSLSFGQVGVSIRLEPDDDITHEQIWQYRNQIADATGVRFPDHETYKFHISLAYQIQILTEEEQETIQQLIDEINKKYCDTFGIFNSGKPQLTFFDDMFDFVRAEHRLDLQSRKVR
ncbi:MAG: DUF1868 domain-containing protein [Chloroflexota bacterium]